MSGEHRPYREELAAAVTAALAAGAVVQDYYERAVAATYAKVDGSPVTDADLAADQVIREVLSDRFVDIPILSEERQSAPRRLSSSRCWIVDPIDGTEQFIRRTGEFDILVALVENGRPIVAAGYQPPTQTLVTATRDGGAWVRRGNGEPREFRLEPAGEVIRLATSTWFGAPENLAIIQALAVRLGAVNQPPSVVGFSPRIFLPPRAIDAMVGVRPGKAQRMASEWDFAVADLVFHEAGGVVSDLEGGLYRYNKAFPEIAGGLVAAVDPVTHERVVAALRAVRECLATG